MMGNIVKRFEWPLVRKGCTNAVRLPFLLSLSHSVIFHVMYTAVAATTHSCRTAAVFDLSVVVEPSGAL